METGDNQGAKNVSDTLLNIYECTVSPRKYSNLTQNLGAFLETTQDDTTLEQIENHSETIWPTLTENIAGCFETHSTQPAEFVSDHVQPTGPETDALSKFLSTIYPNDAKRLNTYLKPESQIKETIIRVVSDTDSKTLLYLVRFQNRQMHFFPMTNSIENEVEKLIVDSFNISGSEMMVLRGLVSGLSLKEIAADTGKSIETIRSQMKSLSGKMGLSRQQELASAISTVAKMTLQTSADVQQTAGTEQTITYTKLGDPNGKPVLFVHDFSGGRHWPEAAANAFAHAGICLISVSRPGYGTSTPVAKIGQDLITSHAETYKKVLDQEGIETCPILAFGLGFGFAYHFALTYPDRVSNLLGANVYPPVLRHKDAMQFPKGMYRAGALASLYAPRTSQLLARYGARRASLAHNAKDLDKMTGVETFKEGKSDDYFTSFLRPNLNDIFMQQGEGTWRDCTCVAYDWALADKSLNTRPQTTLLHHADFPFVNEPHVAAFADTINANFHTLNTPFRRLHLQIEPVLRYLEA